jgi:hypothetical protein
MFKRILVAYDESPAIRTCSTHRHPSRQELKCRVERSVEASASLSRRITEVGAQLQLRSERAPEWIQPGGINRLATPEGKTQ